MIKVTNKMLKQFLEIMDEYGEFVFGDMDQIKAQLQCVLNSQGYWSGNSIRVYYDKDTKQFYVGNKWSW